MESLKRPRTDVIVENGRLASPPYFASLPVCPRMSLLPRSGRVSVVKSAEVGVASAPASVGGDASASSSQRRSRTSSTAALGAEGEAPPIFPAPSTVALDGYLQWVGSTYYSASEGGAANREWALLRRTTLGRLAVSARETCVFDHWAPIEVAKFESAICLFGKDFSHISKVRCR